MNRPYYDQIGIEPRYNNSDVLEDVYDDRQLDEEDNNGFMLTWENLKTQLTEKEGTK